jgi:hypothetical protein
MLRKKTISLANVSEAQLRTNSNRIGIIGIDWHLRSVPVQLEEDVPVFTDAASHHIGPKIARPNCHALVIEV